MKISKLHEKKKVVFSFEIFPPKPQYPIETVYDTLEALGDLDPDYISVTYGAGGSARENRTCELSSMIKKKWKTEPLAHLTCVGSQKQDIDNILQNLQAGGIQNILALRGDIPEGETLNSDFAHAADLIQYIKQTTDFDIAAACYPEKHSECESLEQDITYLKEKVDCGVDHLITQLFFYNDHFYSFYDKIVAKGIRVPVTAGIMPMVNKNQVQRMATLCGAQIPEKYLTMVEKYRDDPAAVREAGIIYALEQIVDLIANGVQGIHIYTMNNPLVARKITMYLQNILAAVNGNEHSIK